LGASVAEMASLHRAMQRSSRNAHQKKGGKGGKWSYRPFCTDIAERTTLTSATGTAYFPVKILQPNSSAVTEASVFNGIFDEQRCKGITIHVRCSAATTVTGVEGAWAVVFDVANSGAYSSVVGTVLTGQKLGPVALSLGSGTNSFTKTGFITHRFKTLNTLPPTGANQELVGGGWFASLDTNGGGPNVGFLKYAVDAVTGATATFDTFIVYHMEYRERT